MRWYIIRTLLHKELQRNLANRGGIALAGLLVVAAMLLSFFNRGEAQPGGVLGGVQRCYLDYAQDDDLIRYLRDRVPPEWRDQKRLVLRPLEKVPVRDGIFVYDQNAGAIQIYNQATAKTPRYEVLFWHHGKDSTVLAPYESWFWKEFRRYLQKRVGEAIAQTDPSAKVTLPSPDLEADELWAWKESHRFYQEKVAAALDPLSPQSRAAFVVPDLSAERRQFRGPPTDIGTSLATSLVLFALFFSCVYTLPSITCEEHERGILLAQALSPASPTELLTAKFLFYPLVGIGLATILAGIINLSVLGHLFYWLALILAAFGSMGIGMTIASVARTQREASMGALCYMMAVALILLISQQNQIPVVPYLFLEFHYPRLIQAALSKEPPLYYLGHLLCALLLGIFWAGSAAYLFRRRGWQ